VLREDQVIRLGIIGMGGRGHNFAARSAIQRPDMVLAAVADTNVPRAETAKKQLGASFDVYGDYRELIARQDVDTVTIMSPDCTHAEIACAALAAGKNIFVDKPLATKAADALKVVGAWRRSGKVAYMGFNLRHDPVVHRMKNLVDDGQVGRPFQVVNQEWYSGGRTYMSRWNRLSRFSGGLWVHKGTHDFDVLNWIVGAHPARVASFAGITTLDPQHLPFELKPGETPGPYCKTCQARERCPDRHTIPPAEEAWYGEEAVAVDGYRPDRCMYLSDKDTHDSGVAIIEYENGARACHWECFVCSFDTRRYAITGDRGHLDADLGGRTIVQRPRWSKDIVTHTVAPVSGMHGGADPGMFEEFVRAVRDGGSTTATLVDGVWAVAVGQAAETSRREKRVVEITEVLDTQSELLR
jgi:predicted dehydrogenase